MGLQLASPIFFSSCCRHTFEITTVTHAAPFCRFLPRIPSFFRTGCSASWINLTLAEDDVAPPVEDVVTCEAPAELICQQVTSDNTPVLDGNVNDWSSIEGITTDIQSIFGTTYAEGEAKHKCVHDGEKVYFSLEVPGAYRFDPDDNKKCASIGTMMKIGPKAAYLNMGGCPEALQGCDNGPPPECDEYRVDLGAHWELRTTQQGVEYPMNATTGSGNDLIANLDDEYGVSPFCRPDDDDAVAANE